MLVDVYFDLDVGALSDVDLAVVKPGDDDGDDAGNVLGIDVYVMMTRNSQLLMMLSKILMIIVLIMMFMKRSKPLRLM